MADYIGTAQYGKPIEYSSQPNGGMYPSWINTDYSGIFDALGESISGVIKAKKEAAEEEKKEKEKLEKENSALIEKYYIDMPETGDDSQYFLTKVDDYNNTAKGYIDAAISAGNSYLTPEQIVELKKKSNAILAEKNLSDLNQSTVSEVRNKYFSQEGQYDPTAFDDWMEGYNKAGTIQDKAKYIQQNKNPLVPVVTLGDAFKDMKAVNLGTTTKMMGNTSVTVVDPQNVEDGIALMESEFPQSSTAKYINAGKDETEKEQRRDNIVKMYGLQEDTRQYRNIARGGRSGKAEEKKEAITNQPIVYNGQTIETKDTDDTYEYNTITVSGGNQAWVNDKNETIHGALTGVMLGNDDELYLQINTPQKDDEPGSVIYLPYDKNQSKILGITKSKDRADLLNKFKKKNSGKQQPAKAKQETPQERAKRIASGG